ncbi:MAG: RNA-binding S4 domain-containing protein [Prevotellaceae bacterium]|jgi:ribosome-associated heat shock protein Hsp15|nr:RNA-binding S4 domain-containing protein [Prevotellaceae bacterium]
MNARADKWLWAVRIFKTRTDAAEACRKGKVLVNGLEAKPSKELKTGDTVSVKRPPATYVFKVLALIENRQPAKNVPLYAENITPREELDRLAEAQNSFFVQRDRGTGRPTKKERRDIDKFGSESLDDDDDDE